MNESTPRNSFAARLTRRTLLWSAAAAGAATRAPLDRAMAQEATPRAGGDVRMLIRKPTTLNPLYGTSGNEQQISRLIFGALVKMTDEVQPVPDLAETVEASPDVTTYTFTLRPGLTFNDGQPLTSRDVAFTYARAVDARAGSVWRGRLLGIAGAEAFGEQQTEAVSGIETPDERTVIFTLTAPDATFLQTIGNFSGLGILPAHALQDIPPDQFQNETFLEGPVVSAGAFEFVRYEVDQFIEVRRNETYGDPPALLDRILMPIRTPAIAMTEMETGDLDIMRLPLGEVDRVEEMENVGLVSVPSPSMDFVVLNHSRPALQDKRVRQAMMYALDRATIVESLLQGRGEVVNSPIFGPDWMGIPAGLNPYEYNPDTARQLLADAGWDANQTLEALIVPPNQDWWSAVFQQQLNDVGLNVELVQVDSAQLLERIGEQNDFDLFFNGGGTFRADPNNSARQYTTANLPPAGTNWSRYSNSRVDELYEQGKTTGDLEERRRIYTEAAHILNDEVASLFLWSPNSFFAVNDRVHNFKGPGYVDNRLWNAAEWFVSR